MELDLLTAISPIDGRYRGKAGALASYFSEFALIKYRVQVEIEYFITLCELPLPQLKSFDHARFDALRAIYKNFSEADAQRIKEIESVTNHDVKAVEYFIKEEFDKLGGMEEYKEFIHFGLTSQDINNTSVPLSIKEALEQVYYPQIEELIAQLTTYAEEWANIPMLAKTHGQPASPTRLGKEIMVFVYRLNRQLAVLKACPVTAKFAAQNSLDSFRHHTPTIIQVGIDCFLIQQQFTQTFQRTLDSNHNVTERYTDVTQHSRVCQVTLQAGNRQLRRKVLQNSVCHT